MWSVYCDGSSSGKSNKPGGYGWLLISGGSLLQWGYGGSPSTTNNLMEMEAIIQAIENVLKLDPRKEQTVEFVSDSQYALGIATGEYQPSKNYEQAIKLRKLALSRPDFKFRWVRGHNGDKYNEAADMLAKQGKLEHTPVDQRPKPAPKPRREEKARRKTLSEERAEAKAVSRKRDEEDLKSGAKTPEQLRNENSHFTAVKVGVRLDLVKSLC